MTKYEEYKICQKRVKIKLRPWWKNYLPWKRKQAKTLQAIFDYYQPEIEARAYEEYKNILLYGNQKGGE